MYFDLLKNSHPYDSYWPNSHLDDIAILLGREPDLKTKPRYKNNTITNPRINMYSADRELIVNVEVPGLSDKDIDVTVTCDTLSISGKNTTEPTTTDKILVKEYAHTIMSRKVPLPFKIDTTRAVASVANGILTVRMARTEGSLPRKVEVVSTLEEDLTAETVTK